LSRLAQVGKIICDKGFSDAVKENEKLRLSLFWTKYSRRNMHKYLVYANMDRGDDLATRCNCSNCLQRKWNDWEVEPEDYKHTVCAFLPLLERDIAECGLVTAPDQRPNGFVEHECNNGCPTPIVDAHIVRGENWVNFYYGTKISNATSVNDPELVKLKKLFDLLHPEDKQPWWMTA
jgi:hypothetical protein